MTFNVWLIGAIVIGESISSKRMPKLVVLHAQKPFHPTTGSALGHYWFGRDLAPAEQDKGLACH
ncbi:hypothetical protein IE53DRAFT_383225 [Violaceomyces palustris]|uniref:Uncharacterized protein n=1 Tax=Violaceomyces palustris TaxID=1673888 RepID=A0ACD0P827_9BASI|nr:hypothetical protein IE53DRAFT_383225 [Violaceomyces palustris]